MIWTVQLVIAIVKPDRPSPTIFRTLRAERRIEERLSFRIVLSLVKNRRIQMAERSCDRMVASAAPRIPM